VDCSKIKARVVAADERETKGIRTILNFGHTVGHAIETADKYRNYFHGEAVALGMRAATEISRQMGLLAKSDAQRINQVITTLGLPQKIRNVAVADILKYMQFDKKFKAKKNRFVLVAGIGSVKVVEGVPLGVIRSAIETCR
jgi:3-dehydroquinate synthetase